MTLRTSSPATPSFSGVCARQTAAARSTLAVILTLVALQIATLWSVLG
jgi:hypothetical protein